MYLTKKQKKIIDDLMWYSSEMGLFDTDHSSFLDNNCIDIEDIENLQKELRNN